VIRRRTQQFAYYVVSTVAFITSLAPARVTVPDVLSDGMVLQRGAKVPIWGTADPGESITVRFASQTKKTIAGPDGKWRVELSALHASSNPRSLTIVGTNTLEIRYVLVGEVWLVAGQSNMQLTLPETANGEAAAAAADDRLLRLFNVSRKVAFRHAGGPLGQWAPSSPQSVKEFSAAGYYFGAELLRALHVPVGIINASYGGSQAEAWTPIEYLVANPDLRRCVEREKIWNQERPRVQAEYDQKVSEWRAAVEKAKQEGARPPLAPAVPDALREYRIAASIYSGMIEPLVPFAIRGAIWYQGESNEERAQQYGILLPTMISAWRVRWGEGRFPFGIVQLPNYRDPQSEPMDEAWSFLREAQRRTSMSTRNSGLIVTIDLGEDHDIHPKDKLDVGKRMARWALADAYHRKVTPSGPMFRAARLQGSKIIVTFTDAGKGLRLRHGDRLEEFAIAGADHEWHWASAEIVGKDRVEVRSQSVPHPVAVRYAFNSNPRNPNLTNDTGLPAAPFRTDDWPDPTDGRR